MADQVHPHVDSPPVSGESQPTSSPQEQGAPTTPAHSMADSDQLHPHDSLAVSGEPQPTSSTQEHGVPEKPTPPAPERPVLPPPSTTDFVYVPEDLVLRIPPPENARLQQCYVHREYRQTVCHCCPSWQLILISILVVLVGIVILAFSRVLG